MVKCFALAALALGQHASALPTTTTPPTTATAGVGGPCNTGGCAASAPVGWSFAGPTTYHDRGDDSGMTSAGAAQNVAAGANGTWFLGSVNGGVWRTSTLRHARPGWANVLDGQPVTCSSISALHVSSTDARRVYAGCGGSTSSEQGSDWNVLNSGDWAGIMASADGGDTWRMLPAFPGNYYVTDILEPAPGTLLVSAQSHLYDRDDGGVWRSTDGGASFAKVDGVGPTFTLQVIEGGAKVLATHARSAAHAVSVSADGGATFADYGRLPWAAGASPFYTCAAPLGDGRLVVAGLTRLSAFPNATSSQFFVRSSSSSSSSSSSAAAAAAAGDGDGEEDAAATWTAFEQPTSMDEDSMPKDRMAILGDPELKDLLYVAGNAGALAWRVNVTSGVWTKMWDADTPDGSPAPHGDCRNYAWDAGRAADHDAGRLVLVSDGGVFARERPREAGGKWVSLNGNYASMELLSAHYDWRGGCSLATYLPVLSRSSTNSHITPYSFPSHCSTCCCQPGDRYIAGAQDNSAQVTPTNSTAADVAVGFVGGDGTVTAVDSHATPSRLFGTTQFIGVGTIDIDPSRRRLGQRTEGDGGDDDDDCGGLCFVQGDKYINVPIDKYFPEPSSFPFFVQPYVLNRFDPTKLTFWTNGTAARPSAFYQFDLPYSIRKAADIAPPAKVLESPAGAFFLDFVAGGVTAGAEDPSLLLGVSNTHLYVRSAETEATTEGAAGAMVARKLPVAFARPVTMEYDEAQQGARILGPVTHGRTVSLAVSAADSRVVAVTGWPSVSSNEGDELIFLSRDAGKTWTNVTANLKAASGVVGKVRPGGLLIVDGLPGSGDSALLTGASSGVLASFFSPAAAAATAAAGAGSSVGDWSRLGTCSEFPIVLTADLSYEPHTDRIVAATFGRGIYSLVGAKKALAAAAASCQ